FNYNSLNHIFSKEQQYHFKLWYQLIKHHQEEWKDRDIARYISLRFQSWFLNDFYEETLKANVQKGISYSSEQNRENLARLEFPPYKNFVLNRGENYLAQMFNFWGADLSAYLTYCAFTNQFVNCTLSEINHKTLLFFKEDKIQKELWSFYDLYLGED